jgi:hypothetical protein
MFLDTSESKKQIQEDYTSCGSRTVALAVSLKTGQDINHSEIGDELGTTEAEGTDILEIERFFTRRPEYKMKAKTGWAIEEIQDELDSGRGIIVAYQNWQRPWHRLSREWGHYGMIYKIEGGRVYLFDPGADETDGLTGFSTKEFLRRWWEKDFNESKTGKVPFPRWGMSLDLSRQPEV